jgi:acetyl-CoA carboxylase biotin carboxyl carrier protein
MIEVQSEMDATVWQILVEVGQSVSADDEVIILESMKMEIPVVAPSDGVVTSINVGEAEAVKRGQTLLVLD